MKTQREIVYGRVGFERRSPAISEHSSPEGRIFRFSLVLGIVDIRITHLSAAPMIESKTGSGTECSERSVSRFHLDP